MTIYIAAMFGLAGTGGEGDPLRPNQPYGWSFIGGSATNGATASSSYVFTMHLPSIFLLFSIFFPSTSSENRLGIFLNMVAGLLTFYISGCRVDKTPVSGHIPVQLHPGQPGGPAPQIPQVVRYRTQVARQTFIMFIFMRCHYFRDKKFVHKNAGENTFTNQGFIDPRYP